MEGYDTTKPILSDDDDIYQETSSGDVSVHMDEREQKAYQQEELRQKVVKDLRDELTPLVMAELRNEVALRFNDFTEPPLRCHYIYKKGTNKGKTCVTKARENGFCQAHRNFAPSTDVAPSTSTAVNPTITAVEERINQMFAMLQQMMSSAPSNRYAPSFQQSMPDDTPATPWKKESAPKILTPAELAYQRRLQVQGNAINLMKQSTLFLKMQEKNN